LIFDNMLEIRDHYLSKSTKVTITHKTEVSILYS
jgi:hypothetical protein